MALNVEISSLLKELRNVFYLIAKDLSIAQLTLVRLEVDSGISDEK